MGKVRNISFRSHSFKKIILSELYCCNMIIFCKLLKIKIVQTSLCEGAFLVGEAV